MCFLCKNVILYNNLHISYQRLLINTHTHKHLHSYIPTNTPVFADIKSRRHVKRVSFTAFSFAFINHCESIVRWWWKTSVCAPKQTQVYIMLDVFARIFPTHTHRSAVSITQTRYPVMCVCVCVCAIFTSTRFNLASKHYVVYNLLSYVWDTETLLVALHFI